MLFQSQFFRPFTWKEPSDHLALGATQPFDVQFTQNITIAHIFVSLTQWSIYAKLGDAYKLPQIFGFRVQRFFKVQQCWSRDWATRLKFRGVYISKKWFSGFL